MTYFLDIFSVATYEDYGATPKTTAGFRPDRKAWVAKIKAGDKLLCYMKGLSAWIGMLEVTGAMFERQTDGKGGFDDEFTLCFPVRPEVWLDKDHLLPIKEPGVWQGLSFTRNIAPGSGGWNGPLRSSGTRLATDDGVFLESCLRKQAAEQKPYVVDPETWERLKGYAAVVSGKSVTVAVPEKLDSSGPALAQGAGDLGTEGRESIKIQAALADIGTTLGLKVWIPKSDRGAVSKEMKSGGELLEKLPFIQFSEPVLKTVEQIDVLWLNKNAIVRAFEVEHTTAVYSGILRMADLLALQPNLDCKLHIVAPEERRAKVFQELRRPAFSIFPKGALSELCTYLSYQSVLQIANQPFLHHMKSELLDDFEESADS